MRKPQRKDLINQIQEFDMQIRCYVEEDFPKPLKELQKLSITELRNWHDRRIAVLKFLTDEDVGIDEIDQTTKS
jgi:hypothetical protein